MDDWFANRWIVNPRSPTDYTAQIATERDATDTTRLNASIPFPVAQGLMVLDVSLNQSQG
jgi:hypothetical protein